MDDQTKRKFKRRLDEIVDLAETIQNDDDADEASNNASEIEDAARDLLRMLKQIRD